MALFYIFQSIFKQQTVQLIKKKKIRFNNFIIKMKKKHIIDQCNPS